MCPACIMAAALTTAGAATGAGVVALMAARWRDLSAWYARRKGGG